MLRQYSRQIAMLLMFLSGFLLLSYSWNSAVLSPLLELPEPELVVEETLEDEEETPVRSLKGAKVENDYRTCLVKAIEADRITAQQRFTGRSRVLLGIGFCPGMPFPDIVNGCLMRHSILTHADMHTYKMGRFGERKFFLRPSLPLGDKCVLLTIGIGGDSDVEEQFSKAHPGCRLFGIEPSRDQLADFPRLGTVIPFAVGVRDGQANLTVREGTAYISKTLHIRALPSLMDEYIHSRWVPYGTIDIEGFEYGILDAFREGQPLYEANTRICVLDAELHKLDGTPKGEDFAKFALQFFRESDFLPIHANDFLDKHRKATFLDTGDPDCRRFFPAGNFLTSLAQPAA